MTNWLCFYEKKNYDDADNLFNTMSKASTAYGLKVSEPKWIEMPNNSKAKDWIDTAEEYFPFDEESDYDFVVFLLGRNDDNLYAKLKKHSICKNGYVSQVVKTRSIRKKGALSVCSKILLQINAKLGGISYKINLTKEVKDRKLMVLGVDSSHIKGKRTGVAMVASINDSFSDFYNKEEIINEENKAQLKFCVSAFIEEAIEEFKKVKVNKGEKPKGIIIYRQGVSFHQKQYLKDEIAQINECCKTKGILFYYILVNTKTTFKFFEKTNNGYINPQSGLLIIDGITNKNYFEFYIQPQQVTEGSATPTCFHVAYGNLDFPEMIPKFTFDLCHIYSNWQGTVRIPNVIKAAEKLAKITAKYTLGELSENLKSGQAYL
jgi:aubergine-like protein